ncbi:hypothetical protein NC653_031971 [Populus alba x Populus x berolinensis]|uniref:Uncharacterized protein n=1 Tax=Populus alba x Populus x berolinensis TaxID=444605 RepID=A0AAD6LZP5_9ROSI|nr:hypothetical protein NC653_031971 [Populus alba x Populus x berolinensis]
MDSPHAGIKGQTPVNNHQEGVATSHMINQLCSSHIVNRSSNSSKSRPFTQRCSRTISLGREPHPHPNEFLPSG